MTRTIASLLAASFLFMTACSTCLAQADPPAEAAAARSTDLPRFLPNDGNSVYNVAGLLRQWPAEGPRLLWQKEIGWGKSASTLR